MKDLMDGLTGGTKKRGGRRGGMKSMEHEAMHGRTVKSDGMGPEARVKSSGSDKKYTEEPMDKPEGMEGELNRAHEDHKKRIHAIVQKHMPKGKKGVAKKSEHHRGPKATSKHKVHKRMAKKMEEHKKPAHHRRKKAE